LGSALGSVEAGGGAAGALDVALGGSGDVGHFDVGQPQRMVSVALDDSGLDPCAGPEHEVGARAHTYRLGAPAEQSRVEGAGAWQVVGMQLDMDDRMVPLAHLSPLTAAGAEIHRSCDQPASDRAGRCR